MSNSILCVIFSLVVSFIVSWLIITMVTRLAYRKQIFDKPNRRKIHVVAVPRLAGVAFFPATLFAMLAVAVIARNVYPDYFGVKFTDTQWVNVHITIGVLSLAAAMVIYFVGIIDDLHGVRYRTKFVAQIIAGLCLCFSGLWINDLHGIMGLHEVSPWIGWPVTIFAIVFITNAINFIDGIDGLASGLCVMAMIYYIIVLLLTNSTQYAILAGAVLGALLPFLWINLMGTSEKRTKSFMGDTGSLFLGLIVATLGVVINWRLPESECAPNVLAVAFAPLILPCYDAVRVVIHRLRNHRNPFKADRNHIHHKFVALGFNQHQALVAVLVLAVFLSLITVYMSAWWGGNVALVLSMALWGLFNIWLTKIIKKQNKI